MLRFFTLNLKPLLRFRVRGDCLGVIVQGLDGASSRLVGLGASKCLCDINPYNPKPYTLNPKP